MKPQVTSLVTTEVEQFRQIFVRWARYDPVEGMSDRERRAGILGEPRGDHFSENWVYNTHTHIYIYNTHIYIYIIHIIIIIYIYVVFIYIYIYMWFFYIYIYTSGGRKFFPV